MIAPRKALPSLLALGMAAALAGCGNEKMEAELASPLYAAPVAARPVATVDAGEALPAERATELTLARRVFSVGAADGDERYLFGRIADVATSAGGDTVYVLDRMERRIKAFDAAGEFLFDFGRGGDGPGEYQSPSSLVTLPWNGRLAVWDYEDFRRGLDKRVEVVAVDSATMRDRLRVEATPATLLVEGGAVRRVYAGPLNAPAKREVMEWVDRSPRER